MQEFSTTRLTLEEMARELNPTIRGWVKYYGKFKRYTMRRFLYFLDKKVAPWLRKRYQRLKQSFTKAYTLLRRIYREKPY